MEERALSLVHLPTSLWWRQAAGEVSLSALPAEDPGRPRRRQRKDRLQGLLGKGILLQLFLKALFLQHALLKLLDEAPLVHSLEAALDVSQYRSVTGDALSLLLRLELL